MGQLSQVSDRLPESVKRWFKKAVSRVHFCEIHGYYTAVRYTGDSDFTLCPECENARVKEEEARKAEERLRIKMKRAGIGEAFLDKSFSNFDTTVHSDAQGVCDLVEEYAVNFSTYRYEGHGRCLMLMGKCGTGKNHLITAAMKEILRQGYQARIIRVYSLLRSIKETWRKDSPKSESEVLASYVAPDLLVVNEIGVQFDTANERSMLHDLFDDRYDAGKPTAVISNYNEDEIKAFLGERIFERISHGRVLNLDWPSQRERFK